jgi:preprotein translocase subunit YajC
MVTRSNTTIFKNKKQRGVKNKIQKGDRIGTFPGINGN